MRFFPISLVLLVSIACTPSVGTMPDADGFTGEAVSYPDADGDGFNSVMDCDDANPYVNPGAAELIDGIDNDCDGAFDCDDTDAIQDEYMYDGDADGYGIDDGEGNTELFVMCDTSQAAEIAEVTGGDASLYVNFVPAVYLAGETVLDGWTLQVPDCDDARADVNPAAIEICDVDGVDEDCDGDATDGGTPSVWYLDYDLDAYGDAASMILECGTPEGYVADNTDCNDDNASVFPGAIEFCDMVDNDCDTYVDDTDPEGATGVTVWYYDADTDGYGDDTMSTLSCAALEGQVAIGGDCDVIDNTVYPGAQELCSNDGTDNDCDGDSYDDASDKVTWTRDGDNDGYGDSAVSYTSCIAPDDYIEIGGDCNDANVTVYPGANEINDDLDNDCDGETDEDVTCGVDIELFDGEGVATSVIGMVSTDSLLSGDWFYGVTGVSMSQASLGGDDYEYMFSLNTCLGAGDYIYLDAFFATGESLGDGASATVYAWQDGVVLAVTNHDVGDGTYAVLITQ